MDQEDKTYKSSSCNDNIGRRRREVHEPGYFSNAYMAIPKFFVNAGAGIVSVADAVVTAVAPIFGIETVNSPLMCLMQSGTPIADIKDNLSGFTLNENKKLDLSKLKEALETHSLRSIREKLINVLGNVFAFLKELFRHTKKVFYVVTMCLMITDGYK